MTESIRIDKWLWQARLATTRSLAARLCDAGAVGIEGRGPVKPSYGLRPGEVVAVPRGRFLFKVKVRTLGTRRGPPAEARLLYDEIESPIPLQAPPEPWTPLLDDA